MDNLNAEYGSDWIAKMASVCEESSTIDSTLFGKYEVKRGLRDLNVQVAVVQGDSVLLDQVVDTSGVGDGSAADDTVNLVALLQQKLCQIGTVLTSDASNQCFFHNFDPHLKREV